MPLSQSPNGAGPIIRDDEDVLQAPTPSLEGDSGTGAGDRTVIEVRIAPQRAGIGGVIMGIAAEDKTVTPDEAKNLALDSDDHPVVSFLSQALVDVLRQLLAERRNRRGRGKSSPASA